VDSSRVRNEGGYGLGLSIAKSIAEEHKAKIYVGAVPMKEQHFLLYSNNKIK
jgi:signal transduction histidine kinase